MFKGLFRGKREEQFDPCVYFEKYADRPISRMILIESDKVLTESTAMLGENASTNNAFIKSKYINKTDDQILTTSIQYVLSDFTSRTINKRMNYDFVDDTNIEKVIDTLAIIEAYYLFSSVVLISLLSERENVKVENNSYTFGMMSYYKTILEVTRRAEIGDLLEKIGIRGRSIFKRIFEAAQNDEEIGKYHNAFFSLISHYFLYKSNCGVNIKEPMDEYLKNITTIYLAIIRKI